MKEKTTNAKQIVYSPQLDTTTGIISVLITDDEEVEFLWWHRAGMPNKITGYTIKRVKP